MLTRLVLTSSIILLLCCNTFAQTMSVAFTGAEVRSAPSAMASKVVFKADKYYPLSVTKEGAEYFQVSDFRGRSGYIHKSLLKELTSVVVTGDKANVRSGPGTSNEVVFQVSKGEAALLLNKQEGWVEIKTAQGLKGWVADFLIWGE